MFTPHQKILTLISGEKVKGQAKGDNMKSSYSMNANPVIEAYERKIVEIQKDPNLEEDEKTNLIALIEQKIKDQTQ